MGCERLKLTIGEAETRWQRIRRKAIYGALRGFARVAPKPFFAQVKVKTLRVILLASDGDRFSLDITIDKSPTLTRMWHVGTL
jgi:hypothetical protein